MYTTVNFDTTVTVTDPEPNKIPRSYKFEYPFRFGEKVCPKLAPSTDQLYITADVSSDAQFFVATAVLSILYCIFIIAVYTMIDEIYQTKQEVPLAVSIETFYVKLK